MTFEEKMEIVINNYFKKECSVNTSIREAFEKGFRIGVKKGQSAQPERIRGHWIPVGVGGALYQCDQCGVVSLKHKFCSECGADMREVTE